MKSKGILFIFICLISFISTLSGQINDLPRSTPEAEGMPSQAVINFLDTLQRINIEVHSFMVLRHGKVIAEGWWNPMAPVLKHTLYSCSKTFAATAVGLAVDDGYLTVEDRVINFFPEYLPETISENLSRMKIKHLLMMSTGQSSDPTGKITSEWKSWEEGFFTIPVEEEPGSRFVYNSMATYMLSAIVQKVTGKKILDYLQERIFDPLHIKEADWEESPTGVCTGGWGLRLQTESLAKAGQLFLQKGEWNGKQLISANWIEDAMSPIISNRSAETDPNQHNDWTEGYGYQMWRCLHNSVRMDGAYGQLVVISPDYDLVVVMTSCSNNVGAQLGSIWKNLIPAVQKDALPLNRVTHKKLEDKAAALALPLPKGKNSSATVNRINKKQFLLNENKWGLERVSFDFSSNECIMELKIGSQEYVLPFSYGKWHVGNTTKPMPYLVSSRSNFEGILFKIAGSYAWTDSSTLELVLRYIDGVHSEKIICRFTSDGIQIHMQDILNVFKLPTEITGKIQ